MEISIIMCTFNRSEILFGALESLEEQTSQDLQWEVLIVDNNSRDSTREVSEFYIDHSPHRFKYIFEPRQGKSYALNAGIDAAGGRILTFTDDDCLFDPHWVHSIKEEFGQDPDLGVLGGRVELYDTRDKPITISPYKDRIAFSPERLFNSPLVMGCNMAFRKEVFNSTGKFDLTLGPGSKGGAIAEDTDIVYRAYRKGFKIIYSPRPVIYHNHGRRTDKEVQALHEKYWMGKGAFYCKHVLDGDGMIAKWALWDVRGAMSEVIGRAKRRESTVYQRRLLKSIMKGILYRLRSEVGQGLRRKSRG